MKRWSLVVAVVIANSFLRFSTSTAQQTNFLPNGATYIGEMKDGEPNGSGTMKLTDGLKLVGQFKDGNIDGHGKMIYPDGRVEEGLWKDGKFIGAEKSPYPLASHAIQNGMGAVNAPANSEINKDIGPLGYIVGTHLTIEGTHPAEFLSSTSWHGFHLDVSKVNGEQLAKPIRIVLSNVNDFSKFELSSNVVYCLRGQEWCFKGCSFVIAEVVSPPGYVLSYGIVKKSE